MVDPAFAAKFGLNRLDRHTIGLDRTVTATFADHGIDEDPGGRVGKRAALAAAAFLGGAGLVKNDDRTARCRAHLLLDHRQIIAVEQPHRRGQDGVGVTGQVLGQDNDLFGRLRHHLLGDLFDRQFAIMFLAASHGDRVIVEDFVGDVGSGGDRLAHSEQAGVEIGAVAQIGEDMGFTDERGFTDPGDTFATHLGKGLGFPLHPQRHDMAANTGQRAGPFRDLG